MVTTDMLLQLIANLQRDMTAAQGRRTLLKYARSLSGARLALLFTCDKEHQTFILLEQSGRRLQHPGQSSATGAYTNREHFNPKRISQHGLFGTVLGKQGFLQLTHPYTDPRSLKEEQYWINHDNPIILSTIGQQQGVLVLCFDSGNRTRFRKNGQAMIDEGSLLVCVTLLSAYLSRNDKKIAAKDGWETSGITQQQELYEIKLQAAIDQERSRIARDIHDGAAQKIAHVLHKLEFVQRVLEKQPEIALREIDRISALLKESLHDLRHGISSLMPIKLEELGFDTALKTLLDEYNEPTLRIVYDREDFTRLPRSLEEPVFRFIQEALNNIRKHAQASRVAVRLRMLAGLLLVEVSDNGRGFDVEQTTGAGNRGSMGLSIMRERIRQAGGRLDIQSKCGGGTIVKARFLLAAPSAALTQREREVLELLVEGLTNRTIAEKLSVSTETIKSHVHHIMQKMHVHDRTQAAVIATKQEWL